MGTDPYIHCVGWRTRICRTCANSTTGSGRPRSGSSSPGMERLEGRPLTEPEKRMAVAQARMIGHL